tara:strand:- start:105 stop:1271 length:1167 start_codon:yes stop_codon:yes gene_type:complete
MVQKIPATSLDSQRPFRNMVINGDMEIAQRGTSATTVVYDTVHTVDQWKANYTQGATSVFSVEQSTDVPSGQGFKKSLLYKCTTAESSLNAAQRMFPLFRVEDNNAQHLEFGTSNAKSVTLSFWVKSNLTGTYQINFFNNPAAKYISDTYVINSANTWEFKTCHFAGDQGTATTTAGNSGVQAEFCLSAGSNYTSGTAPANTTTTYPAFDNANRAASHGVNMASSTDNNWYITGVQLEAGGTGTNFTDPSDFEFLPHDVQLQRCARYLRMLKMQGIHYTYQFATNWSRINPTYANAASEMRAVPSAAWKTATPTFDASATAITTDTNEFRWGYNGTTVDTSPSATLGIDNIGFYSLSIYNSGINHSSDGKSGFCSFKVQPTIILNSEL